MAEFTNTPRVTIKEIMGEINRKRKNKGLEPFPYQSFMNHCKVIMKFLKPNGKIGCAYVFSRANARRIVSLTWRKRYRTIPKVDWSAWKRAS